VAIKDLIDIAGVTTSCHSKVRMNSVAQRDAVVISRLRAAGAILFGKLSLHEFAIGGPAFDLPFPPARNPWSPSHHPGGSSSGCGAALAAGFAPVALGTDTGGSVRNPAGHCGIAGLKPTYDLISRRGVFPLCFTLDHVGPMARSVADLALLMDALASDSAPQAGDLPVEHAFGADLNRGVRDLRVGVVRQFHESDMIASPEVSSAIDEVARVLAREGALVRDVRLPHLQEFATVQRVIFHAESWYVHKKWLGERPGDYAGISRRKLMPGAFLTADNYVEARQRRAELIAAVNDVFRDVDVLLTANSLDPACEIDDEDECARTYPRHARSPFNLTGHPALAVMSGLSATGLPLSVQFVGRLYEDATVLRVGAAYERATNWSRLHPQFAGDTKIAASYA
jgi:aspartyl-tRNA(Asn)/glutamyl-tRNA(Gln) amidotransferase subunit A